MGQYIYGETHIDTNPNINKPQKPEQYIENVSDLNKKPNPNIRVPPNSGFRVSQVPYTK